MLTIKAMVKKDGLRVDRKYNVKLCFTYNRKVKRLSTSLFASPEDLTKSLSFKEGTILKQKVDKLVETYNVVVRSESRFTESLIKSSKLEFTVYAIRFFITLIAKVMPNASKTLYI